MRCICPAAPSSEVGLRNLGDVFVDFCKPGSERETIRRALGWFPSVELRNLTVLFVGSREFTESIFNELSFPVGAEIGWREEVRRMFAHAQRVSHTLIAPDAREVDRCLKGLSDDSRPSASDIKLVQDLASRFAVRKDVRHDILNSPARRGGLEWHVIDGKARLLARRKARRVVPAELVMHFEKDDWDFGLPPAEIVQFSREFKVQHNLSVPVFHVSEFKGLESKAILLYVQNLGAMAEEELLVGVSRARLLLAVIVQTQAESGVPGSLRRFFSEIKNHQPQIHRSQED